MLEGLHNGEDEVKVEFRLEDNADQVQYLVLIPAPLHSPLARLLYTRREDPSHLTHYPAAPLNPASTVPSAECRAERGAGGAMRG